MMKVSLYRYSLLISFYSLEVLVKDMASIQIHISSMCNNASWFSPYNGRKNTGFIQIVEYRPP